MDFAGFRLRNNLFVAPMAGVTDRPFRQLCKRMGAGLAVSEMVTSNSLLYGSEKTKRRANHEGEVAPVSVQIAGADPKMMADAARYNVDNGAQIIDMNGLERLFAARDQRDDATLPDLRRHRPKDAAGRREHQTGADDQIACRIERLLHREFAAPVVRARILMR